MAELNNRSVPTHDHTLSFTASTEGVYKNGWHCDYCLRFSPQQFRWNCLPCTFDLCSNCYMTNNIILLPSTHPHSLSLQQACVEGVYRQGYKCDKCEKLSRSGFRMNCEGCHFDLCMDCFIDEAKDIQQELKLPFHQHKLQIVTSIRICCNLCKSDSNTYCWYCTSCKLYICAPCFIKEYEKMMKIIQIPIHPHPLSLVPSRSVGSYRLGYRCDMCSQHDPTPLKWNCAKCSFDLCENCYFNSTPRIVEEPKTTITIKTTTTTTTAATTDDDLVMEDDDGSLCMVCLSVPRNATFVHQGTGHTICCLECAKLIERTRKVCPVCRRHIDTVIQNFFG